MYHIYDVFSVCGMGHMTTHCMAAQRHGQEAGMCSRTAWSRPRPEVFEAKARGLQGQGHKLLSSRSRPVFEDPHPWAFYRAMLHRERLCHVVCLSITLKFNALLPPLVAVYEVLYLWY